MNQKLFAFWRYDRFPYCLGDEVEFFDDTGKVAIETVPSKLFTPFLILPSDKGKTIIAELSKLETKYHKAKRELEDRYQKQVNDIIEIPKR